MNFNENMLNSLEGRVEGLSKQAKTEKPKIYQFLADAEKIGNTDLVNRIKADISGINEETKFYQTAEFKVGVEVANLDEKPHYDLVGEVMRHFPKATQQYAEETYLV